MADVDSYLATVADARAKGNVHAVNWLTACWMPYPAYVREAARSGPPVEAPMPMGPIKNGKIVFHTSTKHANDDMMSDVPLSTE